MGQQRLAADATDLKGETRGTQGIMGGRPVPLRASWAGGPCHSGHHGREARATQGIMGGTPVPLRASRAEARATSQENFGRLMARKRAEVRVNKRRAQR